MIRCARVNQETVMVWEGCCNPRRRYFPGRKARQSKKDRLLLRRCFKVAAALTRKYCEPFFRSVGIFGGPQDLATNFQRAMHADDRGPRGDVFDPPSTRRARFQSLNSLTVPSYPGRSCGKESMAHVEHSCIIRHPSRNAGTATNKKALGSGQHGHHGRSADQWAAPAHHRPANRGLQLHLADPCWKCRGPRQAIHTPSFRWDQHDEDSPFDFEAMARKAEICSYRDAALLVMH